MLRLLLYILLGCALYLILRGLLRPRKPPAPSRTGEVQTFRDPVCGVYVTAEDSIVGNFEGERIHFCSTECLEKYRADPENTSTKR